MALAVDQIVQSRDAVVKSLGTHLRRVRGVWGATLLGDGTVVLILNAADLAGAADEPRPRVASRPVAIEQQVYNVLVVDDSLSMRHVLSTAIKRAGWHPIQARDGLDALEIMHRSTDRPDLILLDVEMPRMDGYELLSTLRTNPQYADLPIVMLTSRGGDKHRDKASARRDRYGAVHEDVLIETVNRLVTRRVCAIGRRPLIRVAIADDSPFTRLASHRGRRRLRWSAWRDHNRPSLW
jgi:CheY-like chemotaxis protein